MRRDVTVGTPRTSCSSSFPICRETVPVRHSARTWVPGLSPRSPHRALVRQTTLPTLDQNPLAYRRFPRGQRVECRTSPDRGCCHCWGECRKCRLSDRGCMEKCPFGSRSETRISGGISVEEINAPDPDDTISNAHLIHLHCLPSSGEVIPVLLVDRPADASCASRGDSRSPTANRESTTGGRGVGDAPNRPGHFQNACHPFAEEWSVMTTTIPQYRGTSRWRSAFIARWLQPSSKSSKSPKSPNTGPNLGGCSPSGHIAHIICTTEAVPPRIAAANGPSFAPNGLSFGGASWSSLGVGHPRRGLMPYRGPG